MISFINTVARLSKDDFVKLRAFARKNGNHLNIEGGVFGSQYREDTYGNSWDSLEGKQNIRARMDACLTDDGKVWVIRESRDCDGVYGGYKRKINPSVIGFAQYYERCMEDAEGPMNVYIVGPQKGEKFEPYSYGGWE